MLERVLMAYHKHQPSMINVCRVGSELRATAGAAAATAPVQEWWRLGLTAYLPELCLRTFSMWVAKRPTQPRIDQATSRAGWCGGVTEWQLLAPSGSNLDVPINRNLESPQAMARAEAEDSTGWFATRPGHAYCGSAAVFLGSQHARHLLFYLYVLLGRIHRPSKRREFARHGCYRADLF